MPGINSLGAIGSACLMSAASAAVYLMLPVLVGGMVSDLGLSEGEAGRTSAAFFAGYTLVCLLGFLWIRRFNWIYLAFAGYGLLAGGMLSIGFSKDLELLTIWMLVAGTGAGLLLGLGVAMISDMRNAGRIFGVQMMVEQVLPAIMLVLLPLFVPEAGFRGTCLFMGCVFTLLALTSVLAPVEGIDHVSASDAAHSGGVLPVLLAMVFIALYFAGFSGIWAFSERLAAEQNLSSQEVSAVLAFGLIGGAAGGLITALVAERVSRRLLIGVATAVSLLVIFSYLQAFNFWLFTVGTFVFLMVWNIATPCQQALIAVMDTSGRLAVMIPAAFAVGAMVGPPLAGTLAETQGYAAMLIGCAALSLAATVPLLWLDYRVDRGVSLPKESMPSPQ